MDIVESGQHLPERLRHTVVVVSFVVGLFLGNSVLAMVINAGFDRGSGIPLLYTALLAGTRVISIYIGMLYVVD